MLLLHPARHSNIAKIIVVGDSAFGSAENMKLIKKRDKGERGGAMSSR